MTHELGDGPFQLWEDFRGLFKDGRNYCLLGNDKTDYPVGFIVRGFDATFCVERIMAIPLDKRGRFEEEQMLFEFWTIGLHEGQLAISKIKARGEFEQLGFFDVIAPSRIVTLGNMISNYLSALKDETWRRIAEQVLTRSEAQTLYRQWFV